MENNKIKKLLLRNAPTADFNYIRKGNAYYTTRVNDDDRIIEVTFEIPVVDMGDADFKKVMEAKLLSCWIYSTLDKGSFKELIVEIQKQVDQNPMEYIMEREKQRRNTKYQMTNEDIEILKFNDGYRY